MLICATVDNGILSCISESVYQQLLFSLAYRSQQRRRWEKGYKPSGIGNGALFSTSCRKIFFNSPSDFPTMQSILPKNKKTVSAGAACRPVTCSGRLFSTDRVHSLLSGGVHDKKALTMDDSASAGVEPRFPGTICAHLFPA